MTPLLPAFAAALVSVSVVGVSVQAQTNELKQPIDAGPYVPSLTTVVTSMLGMAKVNKNDFVIDLGSGDGRIVLTAAKNYGARGFGVDIKPELVKEANETAKRIGVADRAQFYVRDLFKTDISQATVLTMYLLPKTVNMLSDKFLAELKPGTRIVSHDYGLTDWWPDQTITMDLEEKVAISGVPTTIIYLYTVPAKIAGNWTARLPATLAKEPVPFTFTTQRVTRVQGKARIGGTEVLLEEGSMQGERVKFRLHIGSRPYEFTGTVKGNTIEGLVSGGGVNTPWSAAFAK